MPPRLPEASRQGLMTRNEYKRYSFPGFWSLNFPLQTVGKAFIAWRCLSHSVQVRPIRAPYFPFGVSRVPQFSQCVVPTKAGTQFPRSQIHTARTEARVLMTDLPTAVGSRR